MRVMPRAAVRPLLVVVAAASLTAPAASQTPPPPPATQPAPPPLPATQPAPTIQPTPPPAGPVRRLTIDEAVALGLKYNLGLQVERIEPEVQDANVAQAASAWAPELFGSFNYNDADSPPDSLLAGSDETLKSDRYYGSAGAQQLLPWYGTSYQVAWDAARSTSNNVFSSFNPRLASGFAVLFSQPLLRNFGTDSARTQYRISRNNREISDVDLRGSVAETTRAIRAAFWDLAYTVANLQAQNQSLELARQTLKDNRTRVEVGTMAPIDIVEAEAEVARNEEAVIVAESAIRTAEDRLRVLVFDTRQPDFWQSSIEPVYDQSMLKPEPAVPEEAVRNALDRRTDLVSARKQLENSDLNVRFYKNQTLPEVNFEANFTGNALGGTQILREPGFPPGPILGTIDYGFGNVVGDAFSYQYPNWTVGFVVSYPIGTSGADASLTRARLQYTQAQLQLANLELQVATQVRDAARQVNTNIKRIDATRAARVLSERRLEAEQKKFGVGMSTSFLVFQAQRDLTTARNNELQALVDYAKSRVDFEAVQEAPLGGVGTSLSGGGGVLATPTGTAVTSALTQGNR